VRRFSDFPAAPSVVSALAILALQACASADVSAIDLIARDKIGTIAVTDVIVTLQTPKPNPRLQATLEQELRTALPGCTGGDVPHRMQVTVTDFEEVDVAKAIMVGDEIQLEGRVQLFDMATGEETGEYFVQRSFFWGGFLGAAMMSDAEQSLSKEFAQSVCGDIFGVRIGDQGAVPTRRALEVSPQSASLPATQTPRRFVRACKTAPAMYQGGDLSYTFDFMPGGALSGRVIDTGFHTEEADTGTWKLNNRQLCTTWVRWDSGRRNCYTIQGSGPEVISSAGSGVLSGSLRFEKGPDAGRQTALMRLTALASPEGGSGKASRPAPKK